MSLFIDRCPPRPYDDKVNPNTYRIIYGNWRCFSLLTKITFKDNKGSNVDKKTDDFSH